MDLKGKSPTAFEFIFSAILPILMFFPAFVAGGMVIDSISEELENHTFDTLLSAPLTVSTAIGAKISAALLLTLAQCLAWLGLLRLNRIAIHNLGWVLLLAMITAGIITAGAAIITIFFRNRERSQFVYSLALLVVASGSLLANVSPIKALSRLAVGDFYAGGLDVLVFAAILAVLLLLLSRSTRRLKA
jgi:ABC-type Na+ efflux pump permease subunit